jgi:hypothetical protein
MRDQALIGAIRRAVVLLERPLTARDIADKWDARAQASFLSWMRDLLAKAERGIDIRDECKMIGRNLDYIESGSLYEAISAVQEVCRGGA